MIISFNLIRALIQLVFEKLAQPCLCELVLLVSVDAQVPTIKVERLVTIKILLELRLMHNAILEPGKVIGSFQNSNI